MVYAYVTIETTLIFMLFNLDDLHFQIQHYTTVHRLLMILSIEEDAYSIIYRMTV